MKPHQKIIKETDRLIEIGDIFAKNGEYMVGIEIKSIVNNILSAFINEQEKNIKSFDKILKRT